MPAVWDRKHLCLPGEEEFRSKVLSCEALPPGGGGRWGLPHIGHIGMCSCEGCGFQAVYSRTGYINQSVCVQRRVSFFRKLISRLKILSRLGKQLLQDREIWGVYSSIGQQNSAELALVQVKGSRIPAAHPHPEIPKVTPPPRLRGFALRSSSLPGTPPLHSTFN